MNRLGQKSSINLNVLLVALTFSGGYELFASFCSSAFRCCFLPALIPQNKSTKISPRSCNENVRQLYYFSLLSLSFSVEIMTYGEDRVSKFKSVLCKLNGSKYFLLIKLLAPCRKIFRYLAAWHN